MSWEKAWDRLHVITSASDPAMVEMLQQGFRRGYEAAMADRWKPEPGVVKFFPEPRNLPRLLWPGFLHQHDRILIGLDDSQRGLMAIGSVWSPDPALAGIEVEAVQVINVEKVGQWFEFTLMRGFAGSPRTNHSAGWWYRIMEPRRWDK